MADQVFSGKYVVQREIARGGMGVVYLALDQTLDRQVAIKLLHAHYMGDASFAQRFLREARAMARLNHENIIQIYAVEENQGSHYIVMEYFPSRELKQVLKEGGPLDLGRALRYAMAMIRALSYAHGKGIIHRDIKPGNMMIGEGDLLKLTDFGIAAALGESSATVTGTIMGTPEYMSPEQAKGDRVDARTDMYSLGVVLYEMLAGTTPYKGLAGQTIVGKLAYDQEEVEWRFPDHIPSSLQYLIRSMTKKKTEERFTDSNLISETLKSHLDQLSSLAPPPSSTSSDDPTLALSHSTTPVSFQSQPLTQREREIPKTHKAKEGSGISPQKPSLSQSPTSTQRKTISIEDLPPPTLRRGLSPSIIAVGASVLIVGGGLLFLQPWQVVNDSKDPGQDTKASSSQLNSSVDQLVEQMVKLENRWKTLLAEQHATVQKSETELAAIKQEVGQLGRGNSQQVNRKPVEKVRQQVVAVDKKFQQNHSRYQSEVGDLQAAKKGVLTQMEVLKRQPLGEQDTHLLSQAGQSLDGYESQAMSYQEESKKGWNTQVATLRQSLDGFNQRLVELENTRQRDRQEKQAQLDKKEQEKRHLQQRVEALVAQIDDVKEKVKSTGKAQLMSFQSFQKQVHDWEENNGDLSVSNQRQLDGLSQRLTRLNADFQGDQERYRDELKKYHQDFQEISNKLKVLQTSGLEVSTLKKMEILVQGLQDMFGAIEASQKDANLAWSQDMAKIQNRLFQLNQALVQDEKEKVQDAEKKKIQDLEMIVRDLQQFYQNRDLAALKRATDLSPKQAEVLRALFANWPSFTVQASIDSIEKDSAKVIVQLHEMVDKHGKRAKPQQEQIIGRRVLHIPNQGGEWGKPQW